MLVAFFLNFSPFLLSSVEDTGVEGTSTVAAELRKVDAAAGGGGIGKPPGTPDAPKGGIPALPNGDALYVRSM